MSKVPLAVASAVALLAAAAAAVSPLPTSAFVTPSASSASRVPSFLPSFRVATDLSASESPAATSDEGTSSSSFALNRKPKSGDVVTINLTLKPEDETTVIETLFDSSGTVSFVLGGGNYLPGLHDLIGTMSPGETVEGKSLDAGWGQRRDELIAKVPKDGSNGLDYDKIEVGTELFLGNGGVRCVVTEVTENDFTIDANPPLAGAAYKADVELLTVEEGPGEVEFSEEDDSSAQRGRYEVATVALGCFWGGDLAYMRAPGVVGTKVGYTQGEVENPAYKEVCSGTTGHTEAIQVVYDPNVVTYEELVRLGMDRLGESKFLLNQVGNDRGTQYRHGVYYHTPEQREMAERVVGGYGEGCKTEVLPAAKFWDAEDYHQQYLLKGGQSAKKGADEEIRCYG